MNGNFKQRGGKAPHAKIPNELVPNSQIYTEDKMKGWKPNWGAAKVCHSLTLLATY